MVEGGTMMGEYNPKNKRLPASWRGIQRRIPKTLSTFQIAVLAGFVSLLILRSTIGIGSFNFVGHGKSSSLNDYDGEARIGNSDVVRTDGDPKRSLAQKAEQEIEKKFSEAEHDDGRVAAERSSKPKVVKNIMGLADVEEVKAETQPKDMKRAKDHDSHVAEKATADLKVENFQQVEAQLAEEETADELAEFNRFQRGEEEKVDKKRTTVDKQSERSERKRADKQDRKSKVIDEEAAEQTAVGKNLKNEKPEEADHNDEESTAVEHTRSVGTREVLSMEQAKEQMAKATRRDEPNAFTLGPKISDWDEQRADWMAKNAGMKSTDPHKPKVLLLTGSQPWPCKSPIGDHYLLKMIKNKVDYARIHKLEIFYNLAHLDQPMTTFWAKLPLIRKMMLIHPEKEWIFWMDSDAMFTDMVFEIPFEKYENYNLVMWGYDEGIYDHKSWVACNTGVFFLRNNQWTLDLLETWSHMGPEGKIRNETGKILSSYLTSRPEMMADDQSALVFLMLTNPELRPKILLEFNFWLSGYWADIVDKYEEYLAKSRPGAGGQNWPFTTHFTGCQPCSGRKNEMYEGSSCLDGMERAFNFADNQVLRPFGFEHESLQGSVVKRIRNETTQPLGTVPIHNPWAVESFY